MSVSRKSSLLLETACVLRRLKARQPRVHCIAGTLGQAPVATLLRALGAVPSFTAGAQEARSFVETADALFIDMDAIAETSGDDIDTVIAAAASAGVPWVLDPAMVERSPARLEVAKRLVAAGPRVLRANVPELLALVPERETIAGFARERGITVALSGVVDTVSDGTRQVALDNGNAMMRRVPGLGGAVTAVIAAACAVERDPMVAAMAGLSIVNVAGEIAAARTNGPGSFSVALIDALHGLGDDEVKRRIKAGEEVPDADGEAGWDLQTKKELTAT